MQTVCWQLLSHQPAITPQVTSSVEPSNPWEMGGQIVCSFVSSPHADWRLLTVSSAVTAMGHILQDLSLWSGQLQANASLNWVQLPHFVSNAQHHSIMSTKNMPQRDSPQGTCHSCTTERCDCHRRCQSWTEGGLSSTNKGKMRLGSGHCGALCAVCLLHKMLAMCSYSIA